MEDKINNAFDTLISVIESAIKALNEKSAGLITNNQYQAARDYLAKAEEVTKLHLQVRALLDQWKKLDIALELAPEPVDEAFMTSSSRIKSGVAHGLSFYKMPILKALVKLGGSSKRKFIFDEVKANLAGQMNEYDLQNTAHSSRSIRWIHATAKAGDALEKEGCITRDRSKGEWTITEVGLKQLKIV